VCRYVLPDPLPLVLREPEVRLLPVSAARGRLWVVDDGRSGALYGGNKVRKLSWLLAEAQARGDSDLLVFGAEGSHFVLAVALYAAPLGMRTHVLQFGQPSTPHVRETAQETLHAASSITRLDRPAGLVRALARVVGLRRASGRWPRLLPVGGSSETGTLGWLLAGLELKRRLEQGELPRPRHIFVALGSGGTAAGLAGAGLAGVVGVRVTPRWVAPHRRLQALAEGAQRKLGITAPIDLQIEHGYFAGGYGHWDERTTEAVETGRALGLPLELTYTGKAFAAALAHVRTQPDDVWFVQTNTMVEARVSVGDRIDERAPEVP
jgi:D-cysteine desulfhydrase